jgi:hypothetical protein
MLVYLILGLPYLLFLAYISKNVIQFRAAKVLTFFTLSSFFANIFKNIFAVIERAVLINFHF